MDRNVAEKIVARSTYAAENLHGFDRFNQIELRLDYSGRGMFGEKTTELVVPDLLTLASALGSTVADEVTGLYEGRDGDPILLSAEVYNARVDNLGHDLIVY
jgi:hypothetical protein